MITLAAALHQAGNWLIEFADGLDRLNQLEQVMQTVEQLRRDNLEMRERIRLLEFQRRPDMAQWDDNPITKPIISDFDVVRSTETFPVVSSE